MTKTEIRGSWFNTGYHGHFRSKSRSDFINEFRYLSKPVPPTQFVQRTTAPVRKHVFSTHDNRNSFTTDALYFEQGLGRRRFKSATLSFKPEMLAWAPQKTELDKAGPKPSMYRYDFRGHPPEQMKQLIVKRPKTSFDEDYGKVTTSYRYAHGMDNPNKGALNAMSNDGLSTTPNRRQKSSNSTGRESVASCMSWYIPQPPTRPTVPVATQTVTQTKTIVPAATEISYPTTTKHDTAPVQVTTENIQPTCTQQSQHLDLVAI